MGFYGCNSQEDDVPIGNTIVRIGGEVWNSRLPADINGPDEPYHSNVTPDKVEDLLIGDQGKIFYWGPPWGNVRPDPDVEYRAVVGQCEMVLTGYALVDIKYIFDENRVGPFKADFDKAAEYMVQKLSAAAKEVEASVAEGCGAKNVVDIPKIGQRTGLIADPVKGLTDWISNNFEVLDFTKIETEISDVKLYERIPQITEEVIKNVQNESNQPDSSKTESPYRIDILNGQAQIKYPGTKEWVELKEGDFVPIGSSIFTGMDTTTIMSIKDRGMVEVLSFTELMVNEEALLEAEYNTKKITTEIELRKGEIEVNIKPSMPQTPSDTSGSQGWGMSIYGPFYSAAVRGTHFWVSQGEGVRQATIGVYKGKVEVNTKDGQTTTVTPNGDPSTGSGQVKPGVVVVAQKLSVAKLAIGGGTLLAVIGGILLFLKKKKSRNRKH